MAKEGRPTLYDVAFCEDVIQWGKLGKSKTWMAAKLQISRKTIDNWVDDYPEFLRSMTEAMAHAQAWWEDIGQENIISVPGQGVINASIWSRSMAARFPADWREKSEQTLQGPDGQALTIITRRVIDPKIDGTDSGDT